MDNTQVYTLYTCVIDVDLSPLDDNDFLEFNGNNFRKEALLADHTLLPTMIGTRIGHGLGGDSSAINVKVQSDIFKVSVMGVATFYIEKTALLGKLQTNLRVNGREWSTIKQAVGAYGEDYAGVDIPIPLSVHDLDIEHVEITPEIASEVTESPSFQEVADAVEEENPRPSQMKESARRTVETQELVHTEVSSGGSWTPWIIAGVAVFALVAISAIILVTKVKE